jgi:hypothetical protein
MFHGDLLDLPVTAMNALQQGILSHINAGCGWQVGLVSGRSGWGSVQQEEPTVPLNFGFEAYSTSACHVGKVGASGLPVCSTSSGVLVALVHHVAN